MRRAAGLAMASLALLAPVAAQAGCVFTVFNAPGAAVGTIVNGTSIAGLLALRRHGDGCASLG